MYDAGAFCEITIYRTFNPIVSLMRILRYLTRDILLHTVAVSFVLFLVVFAGRFIRYLAEAAVGSLTGDVLLPIMLFKLPGFFEMILPLGLFIGILLSLGRLYAESEMVVLRACGVGPGRLAGYVLVPTMVVVGAVAFLSLYAAPEGSARAQVLLDNPRSAEGLHILNEGRFRKQRDGHYVTYAEQIDEAGVMHNIFVFEREPGSQSDIYNATFAREGEIVFQESTGRRYLELRGGTRYQGEPGRLALEEIQFDLYGELIPESQGSLRRTTKVQAMATDKHCGTAAIQNYVALCGGGCPCRSWCRPLRNDRPGAEPHRCPAGPLCKDRARDGGLAALFSGSDSGQGADRIGAGSRGHVSGARGFCLFCLSFYCIGSASVNAGASSMAKLDRYIGGGVLSGDPRCVAPAGGAGCLDLRHRRNR